MVDAILDHPAISAVSFVGSSDIAHYVYRRGVAAGKRVQAMGGAKNHGIVMPDADLDQVVADLSGAAFGSAGERCMALPVVVPVGDKTADALREKLIPAIDALRVGVSTDAEAHYGPVVNAAHKQRVENWIQTGVDEGAELVVDGRGFKLQGHEEGFFIGPSLFDHVTTDMEAYKEEIFGPVLQIVRANDFEDAVRLPSEHQYGNGVAIFTRNGHAAREFAARVNVGMVGINVPIPVPVAYHTFGGWKRSAFGDTNQHGMEGVKFWTKVKTITQRWPDGSATAARWPRTADPAASRRCVRHPDDGVTEQDALRTLDRLGLGAPSLAGCEAAGPTARNSAASIEPQAGAVERHVDAVRTRGRSAATRQPVAATDAVDPRLRGRWRLARRCVAARRSPRRLMTVRLAACVSHLSRARRLGDAIALMIVVRRRSFSIAP